MLTYAGMAFPRLPANEELTSRRWEYSRLSVSARKCPLPECWGLLSPTAWESEGKQTRLICTPIQNTQTRTRGCQEAPGERCERMSHSALSFGGRADGREEWRDVKEMQSWGEYNGVSFRYDLIAPCSHHAIFIVMRSAWRSGSLRACCSKCINVYTQTHSVKHLNHWSIGEIHILAPTCGSHSLKYAYTEICAWNQHTNINNFNTKNILNLQNLLWVALESC